MSGAGSGASLGERLRDLLPRLGLDPEQLLILRGDIPDRLQESNLQAWSYVPDFTPLVQYLLQLRRGGRCLSITVCGPAAASTERAFTAVQLAVGFSQHGLRAVVVDTDVDRPGLAGLVSDPHQEGLVDMVRFGRSCRALLRIPVPAGPALLGIGSFPIDGPSPFEPGSWLGIVHRVSVHAEVALFVAQLDIAGEVNPILQATDQVLYVPAVQAAATERELERLRRSDARVAAVVLCTPAALSELPAPPPLRLPEARTELELPEVEPLPGLDAVGESAPPRADAVPRLDWPTAVPPAPATPAVPTFGGVLEPGIPEIRPEPPTAPFAPPPPLSPAPFQPEPLVTPEVARAEYAPPSPAPLTLEPTVAPEVARPDIPAPPLSPAPFTLEPTAAPEVAWPDFPAPPPSPAPFTLEPTVAPEVAWKPDFPVPPPAPAPFQVEPPPVAKVTRRDFPAPPAWGEEPALPESLPLQSASAPEAIPDFELEPVGVGAAAGDTARSHRVAARSAEEASQLRQRMHLDDADFSYSDGGRHSRLPLFMFVAVVLTIGGFLGWAIWSQREVNRRAEEIRASAAEPDAPPSTTPPDDVAASGGNAPPPAPADAGAQTTTGGASSASQPPTEPKPPAPVRPPPATETPPRGGPGTTTSATSGMVYAVHVASYRRLEQANQDLANLRKHGFEGRAVRTDLGSKGIWYRVCVGSYSTKEAAMAARETIIKLPGYDAFAQVRRIAVP